MGDVLFYHLTRRPLETVLPDLLGRTLSKGWRAVVRAGSDARRDDLNRLLWTRPDDGFLPHGSAADGRPERQPIYLTAGPEIPNAAQALFLVDGAAADPAEMASLERTCLLFDDADPSAVAAARAAWRAVTAADLSAVYWAQDDAGRWVKKAESG